MELFEVDTLKVVVRSEKGKTLIFEWEVRENGGFTESFSEDLFAYPLECIDELEENLSTCEDYEYAKFLINSLKTSVKYSDFHGRTCYTVLRKRLKNDCEH